MNKILKSDIVMRTFEGNNEPEKNNNPITSKYNPSKKYALVFDVQFEHGGISKDIVETYETKKLAEIRQEGLLQYGY
jgi:hypothetical protein